VDASTCLARLRVVQESLGFVESPLRLCLQSSGRELHGGRPLDHRLSRRDSGRSSASVGNRRRESGHLGVIAAEGADDRYRERKFDARSKIAPCLRTRNDSALVSRSEFVRDRCELVASMFSIPVGST
jgi:hypothetical protein